MDELSKARQGWITARTGHLTSDMRDRYARAARNAPIAQERLTLVSDELVRIELRRPFRDGTVAIDLDPLSLLCRLAASVPPPKVHLVRYAGVLGAASKLRAQVVPPLPPPTPGVDVDATQNGAAPPCGESSASFLRRSLRCSGRASKRERKHHKLYEEYWEPA